MARPHDWSPLALDSDPVPGDIIGIRIGSNTLKKVAESITTQAEKLRSLSTTEGWDSESGEVFHTNAGKLAEAIEKAHGRYLGVSKALDTYADRLYEIQTTADGYLEDAKNAQSAKSAADATQLPDKDADDYDDKKQDQEDAASAASGDLQTARRSIQQLIGEGGDWTTANKAAADAIKSAIDDDLKDAWYEGFRDLVHSMKAWLDTIKDILAIIGTLLAIAILVLSLIIPGANIIAALMLASLIVAVLNFIIVGAQAIAGDATGEDVAWAALDVVLAAVGTKFPPTAGGKSLFDIASGTFSNKLLSSIAHANVGPGTLAQRVQQFSTFKSSVLAVTDSRGLINSIDTIVGGGFAKLMIITLNGGTAAFKSDLFLKALPGAIANLGITSWGTYKLGSDGPGSLGTIVDMLDWGSYWDDKTSVSVGSL